MIRLDRLLTRPQGYNAPRTRTINVGALISHIQRQGPVSRRDLARAIGLNPATVSKITNSLIADGVVMETGFGESATGRKPVLLTLNSSQHCIVAVNLDRTSVTCAVTDMSGEVTANVSLRAPDLHQTHVSFDMVDHCIELALAMVPPERSVLGIGVGAPGPLSMARGEIAAAGLPGWKDIPVRDRLEAKYHVPAFIDDRANTLALAEKWFGQARNEDDFIYVVVGRGIGLSIMSGCLLYRVGGDCPIQFGHTCIEVDGRSCACGRRGCLETYASLQAVVNQVHAALSRGEPSILADQPDIDPTDVAVAALQGDKLARDAFAEATRYLSEGIGNAINLFHPNLVFVNVHLPHPDVLMTPAAIEALAEHYPGTRFVLTSLDAVHSAAGSASLVLEGLYGSWA